MIKRGEPGKSRQGLDPTKPSSSRVLEENPYQPSGSGSGGASSGLAARFVSMLESSPSYGRAPASPFSDQGSNAGPEVSLEPAQVATKPLPEMSHTGTPWTPAEEQRLQTLLDGGISWSEIAKTFPFRTEGSVKKHWYQVSLAKMVW